MAVPAIGRSLGASVSAPRWTLTSYLLAVAYVLTGALADRFGRRRLLAITPDIVVGPTRSPHPPSATGRTRSNRPRRALR